MPSETTCWTLIEAAARGEPGDRDAFAVRYEPLIRGYLGARWRDSALAQDIADACQDFFVYCFRENGTLDRAERERPGGFRAYLYSTVRLIARRWEERASRDRLRKAASGVDLGQLESDEAGLSQIFDRAWANIVIQEAVQRHERWAQAAGPDAVRRVELLQLRFGEGLPIREIAKRWDVDAAVLHRQYAKARDEYSQALFEVVQFHHPEADHGEIHRECLGLLTML